MSDITDINTVRMTRARSAQIADQLHIHEDEVLDLQSKDITGTALKAAQAEGGQDGRAALGEIGVNNLRNEKARGDCELETKINALAVNVGPETANNGGQAHAEAQPETVVAGALQPRPQPTQVAADRHEVSPLLDSDRITEKSSDKADSAVLQKSTIDAADARLSVGSLHSASKAAHDKADVAVPAKTEQPFPTPTKTGSSGRREAKYEPPAIELAKRQQGQGEKKNGSRGHKNDNGAKSPGLPAVPNVIATLKAETPGKRSTSNKENIEPAISTPTAATGMATPVRMSARPGYDALEAAVVDAATPSPGHSRHHSEAVMPANDPIVALDELEEAVEEVNREIPDVPVTPAKTQKKESVLEAVPVVAEKPVGEIHPVAEDEPVTENKPVAEDKTALKAKKAPVVRTTKAAQARISLAHGPKDAPRLPSLGRPRESIGLGRSTSVRQSFAPSQRVSSIGSNASSVLHEDRPKKEVAIPHSKPRPMSMSFPAPAPPLKSSKAPTRPTFQLPGEAIAAKLKAAKEERTQKEDKKVFKARPVPASLTKAPSVRQTNASRARESMGLGKGVSGQTSPTSSSQHKRASSIATFGPASSRTSTSSKPSSSDGSKPGSSGLQNTARSSTSLANISKPRAASLTKSAANGKGTSKGKEVFNRTANAKDAAEREKREKNDAIRKARAEAAERSKQLSREWAEKKRREKDGARPASVIKGAQSNRDAVVAGAE